MIKLNNQQLRSLDFKVVDTKDTRTIEGKKGVKRISANFTYIWTAGYYLATIVIQIIFIQLNLDIYIYTVVIK